ncbi:MAG TPA: CocE/NonD family hydrolase [Polyangiales bacterium]|nr:CocE/NonD family hydrolase [Polyangiales bacterium]
MTSNRIVRTPLFGILAMLLALGTGCSELSPEADSGDAGDIQELDAAVDTPTPSTPEPDYTEEELEQLASTDEVQGNLVPFHDAPAPDRAIHVAMSDGVRIAVNLYFPPGFDDGSGKLPSVYTETWYTRGREAPGEAVDLYRNAGFVVAIADPRGFGASFGSQAGYLTQDQRNDQREMLAWLSSQPWSDGNVAAVGISVSAMLAEASLASGAPSLKAGIVRAAEFDQYAGNLFPGGIPNLHMHTLVTDVLGLNRGEGCLMDASICPEYQLGPVTGDEDFSLLRQALQDHQNNVALDALNGIQYSDDSIGSTQFRDVSPSGHAAELAEFAIPTRASASWLDGTTAQSALARYDALPNVPMQVSIGATTHLGGLDADPFAREPFAPARVAPKTQFGNDVAFVKHTLEGKPIERGIEYYVLGADTWKTTRVWPPSDVKDQTLSLSAAGLEPRAVRKAGERSYQVDPMTSSGAGRNRWSSQDNHPIYYGDMRFARGERASFDGAEVARDSELVGAPELCLAMRSDQTDGSVFAYLEDVAPDGRATYLTEGVLRLMHRKTKSGGCVAARGTERSFARADAAAVVPGELMQVEVPFLPVAARIQKGHHLRLSLAGADANTFPMVSEAPGTWSIAYGGSNGSTLTVPLKPWKTN